MSEIVSSDTMIALYADDTKIWRKYGENMAKIWLMKSSKWIIAALHEWSVKK